jgi:hypothetical protein
MAYSSDADLIKAQKDIMSLGVLSWEAQHSEAALIIDRALRVQWYEPLARYPRDDSSGLAVSGGFTYEQFDPEKLLDLLQLKRLSVYKTLELSYLSVMMDSTENNPFKMKMEMFKELYDIELVAVLQAGITYDWDGSGDEDQVETNIQRAPRVIMR